MRKAAWFAVFLWFLGCQHATGRSRARPVPTPQKDSPNAAPLVAEAPLVVEAPPIVIIPAFVTRASAKGYIEGKLLIAPRRKSDPPETLFHGKALFDAKDKAHVRVGASVRMVFETNPWAVFEAPIESVHDTEGGIEANCSVNDRRGIAENNALLHGASGHARILVREWQAPSTVPAAALHVDEEGSYVLSIVDEGGALRSRRKAVVIQGSTDVERVWPEGANRLVVSSGLNEGERVVLDSENDVEDGAQVRIFSAATHPTGNPEGPCNRLRFRVEDDIVLDRRTNLVWERVDSSQMLTFSAAKAHCTERRMRLPTVEEAASLGDSGRPDPAVDVCAFEVHGDQLWTASAGEYVNTRWTVNSVGISPSARGTGSEASVRCVHSLTTPQASTSGSAKP